MTFRVLDARNEEEKKAWIAAWEPWPSREVMAHPDYVNLFSRPCDHPMCAHFTSDGGTVLFPFILRPLSVEPWSANNTAFTDFVTPYGYGGPLAWGDHNQLEVFWDHFNIWCSQQNVVSSFMRLSLFEEHLLTIEGTIEVKLQNVIRLLNSDIETIWMDYDHKVRKNVKKARRAGLTVEVDESGSRLGEFLEVYNATMERRQASSQYYFTADFFRTITTTLRNQFVFFHVLKEQRVVSTELVLVSAENMYSYLGGTVEDAYADRPNDLLKQAVIEWGVRKGKKVFVLGGGYEDGDGIFRYKRAFAPKGVVPFKVASMIHLPDAYQELCKSRSEWESSKGNKWAPRNGYFPAYRS